MGVQVTLISIENPPYVFLKNKEVWGLNFQREKKRTFGGFFLHGVF